jgi:SAM-dependent methyltransferase
MLGCSGAAPTTYATPEAWAAGADPVYEPLSRAMIAASPVPLDGRSIVDLGAGTGATSRALLAAGAWPIAVDISWAMLAYPGPKPDARMGAAGPAAGRLVADAGALPLDTASTDGAVAAFCLSHVDRPAAILSEAARVSRPGSPVLAAVFAASGSRHPAVDAVAGVARRWGWRPDSWYRRVKTELEPAVADRDRLTAMATDAGLTDVSVIDVEVNTAVRSPAELVAWRLGGPGLAGFVAALATPEREQLMAEATEAVGLDPQPFRPVIRIVSSIRPAVRTRVPA